MESQSRRSLLKLIAMGGAAATVVPKGMAGDAPDGADANGAARGAAPDPWPMFEPLAPGQVIALGWSISGITPVIDGAAILHLANESGQKARVRVCRNDGKPSGVAHTKRYDFLIMNGGRGETPTAEDLGRVLVTVAGIVGKNEKRLATPWPDLKTHEQA
jgi:hypothetical protein